MFPKQALHGQGWEMVKRSKAARLIQELQDWSDEELGELAEEETQETREDGTPLGKHGGRGHIELKMIPDSKTGKAYGPYRYLRYWGVTKKGNMGLKSVYLGKENG